MKAPARPIDLLELAGRSIHALAREMAETLAKAGGVGLAAPQVGESVRLFLAGSFPTSVNPDRPEIPISPMVNPRIVLASPEPEPGQEGCLSFLQFRVRVSRHTAVTVDYQTLDGLPVRVEASGFFARVLQHEIDHLDGVLTLDRASSPDNVRPADDPPPEE